jgi:hypothetical protein
MCIISMLLLLLLLLLTNLLVGSEVTSGENKKQRIPQDNELYRNGSGQTANREWRTDNKTNQTLEF